MVVKQARRKDTYIATASADATVRLIEISSGLEVARIEHDEPVSSVKFSPDGKWLLTRSGKTTRLFPANPDWPFEQLCARSGQNLSRSEWLTLFGSEKWRLTCDGWRTPDGTASMADAAIH